MWFLATLFGMTDYVSPLHFFLVKPYVDLSDGMRLCLFSPNGLEDLQLCFIFTLFGLLVVMGWGYNQIFTGRAMMLHLGAFTATIMTANVFFIIIPNQKKVVADLLAGRAPDPALGAQAKQRSLHNNYLTLPVLFLMLSNHYPLAFATPYNWVIASLVFHSDWHEEEFPEEMEEEEYCNLMQRWSSNTHDKWFP